MAKFWDDGPLRTALADMARDFHQRGWMAGTAGNLSARDPDQAHSFWITASGLPKGRLDEGDFLRVALSDGHVIEYGRADINPSAETGIHRVIYQLFPEVQSCLHVHSVEASLITTDLPSEARALPLPPLEMLKGLGLWEACPQVSLPLFSNLQDVSAIAESIGRRFAVQTPPLPALLVRNHGLTVWGKSLQDAYNHLEVAEFILTYLARNR